MERVCHYNGDSSAPWMDLCGPWNGGGSGSAPAELNSYDPFYQSIKAHGGC